MKKGKSKTVNTNNITTNEKALTALASTMVERAALASRLGMSYGTTRDIYTALGYTKNPTFEDYYARYKRQDIAKRIITSMPQACWRLKPVISEVEDDETPFETAWMELEEKRKVYGYMNRADKISRIGQYGVLLMGFDDGRPFEEPVERAGDLLYMRPYMQVNADIVEWEADSANERYGLPKIYSLQTTSANQTSTASLRVHYSRVLHIAEGTDEDDVYGAPQLEDILNRLQDLELVAGGSAEMFWRGAFPGYGFKADDNATVDPQVLGDLQDEIEDYMHGLKRYLRMQGFDIQSLSTQVADPTNHVDVLVSLISAAKGIPKRILMGSERGELASTQDEKAWNDRIDERRRDHVESKILRPFIDRLITVGVLPEPTDGYTVEWPPIHIPSAKDEAEVARIRTEALAKYASTPGADIIVPPDIFLGRFLGFSRDEIQQMADAGVNDGDE